MLPRNTKNNRITRLETREYLDPTEKIKSKIATMINARKYQIPWGSNCPKSIPDTNPDKGIMKG